jgi:bile acid-coenzyme A ligase
MVNVPMVEAFRHWAEKTPDAPALTVGPSTLTFAELEHRAERIAHGLAALGVAAGDYVTIAFPNSVAFVEACLALLKLGATIQPVSSRLPVAERRAIVDLAGSRVVLGVEPGTHPGRICLPDLDAIATEDPPAPLPVRISEPWRATTSGGSTGRPKLIVGIPPAVISDLDHPDYLLPVGGTVLIPGPLFHGGPFLIGITSLFHGNHLILEERFDAAATLDLIERHRVQYLLLVPTMMHRIWRLPAAQRDADLSSLTTVLHLASACPVWLKEAWLRWLGPERLFELYGAADAPNRTIISGPEWLAHPGSVGRTRPGEFEITDADGRPLPAGEIGEIWMRPPPGQPARSYLVGAEPRVRDGWTSVGDLGWIDADGYLFVADRRTDMIVTGGENVFPAEVEAALEAHPGVRSCAVVGLPDDELGRRVHAVVEVDDGVTEAALRAHMAEQLVPYKHPRSYRLVDHPVRDDAGKVRKALLISG